VGVQGRQRIVPARLLPVCRKVRTNRACKLDKDCRRTEALTDSAILAARPFAERSGRAARQTDPAPKRSRETLAAARLLRRQDMDVAKSDYAAAKKTQAEKTLRLRALRLEKESADKLIAERLGADSLAAKRKPRTKAVISRRVDGV
jgi:hypothetical protein